MSYFEANPKLADMDDFDFYEPPKQSRKQSPKQSPKRTPRKPVSWYGRLFSHGTRSRLKRCVGTMKKNTYSLPLDIIFRNFKPLQHGDFEVLPPGKTGPLTFDKIYIQLLPKQRYNVESSIDNNWMSRCVRNRFVLPRNFLTNELYTHERTVPYHETRGKLIVFHTKPPPGKTRVPLSDFLFNYGPQGPHGVQTFGGRVR